MSVTFGYCVEAPIEWNDLLALARELDANSRFDSFWMPDALDAHDAAKLEPFSVLAAVASVTSRLRLGSLVEALRGVRARTLLIAFSSDWLYPPSGSEELAAALRAAGKPVECHVMDAPYGHDCFLLEEARQTPMIRQFLGLPT